MILSEQKKAKTSRGIYIGVETCMHTGEEICVRECVCVRKCQSYVESGFGTGLYVLLSHMLCCVCVVCDE